MMNVSMAVEPGVGIDEGNLGQERIFTHYNPKVVRVVCLKILTRIVCTLTEVKQMSRVSLGYYPHL